MSMTLLFDIAMFVAVACSVTLAVCLCRAVWQGFVCGKALVVAFVVSLLGFLASAYVAWVCTFEVMI